MGSKSMIIHLNGRAGVGKLTVAQILAQDINARIVDNHAVLNLVRTLTERRTPEYFAMIRNVMNLVLNEMALKPKDHVYIFTNWVSADHPEDRYRLDMIAEYAERHHIPFLQILLECDLEENKQRIVSQDRIAHKKLTDSSILEGYYIENDTYHPDRPHALMIDTTNKQPQEVVQIIKDYIASMGMWIS
jgi:thymidylate kinase